MKKYKFRLDPVLKLRRQVEDQKKRAVGLLMTEINDLQNQALEMNNAIKDEGETMPFKECGRNKNDEPSTSGLSESSDNEIPHASSTTTQNQ